MWVRVTQIVTITGDKVNRVTNLINMDSVIRIIESKTGCTVCFIDGSQVEVGESFLFLASHAPETETR